jgi:hypothetical protein
VTELRAGRPGFDSGQGQGLFLFVTASRPTLGPTQPSMKWVPRALSPGVKRPEHETDHSPPSGAEIMNVGIRTPTTSCVFMV